MISDNACFRYFNIPPERQKLEVLATCCGAWQPGRILEPSLVVAVIGSYESSAPGSCAPCLVFHVCHACLVATVRHWQAAGVIQSLRPLAPTTCAPAARLIIKQTVPSPQHLLKPPPTPLNSILFSSYNISLTHKFILAQD